MSVSIIENDFTTWIESLNPASLDNADVYILNLLIRDLKIISEKGTAGGSRAKYIGSLLEKAPSSFDKKQELSHFNSTQDSSEKIAKRITKLTVGPFRGFNSSEEFVFNKKHAFLYGPNGSGKSSFCEALEYSLLGSIQESDQKRIVLEEYIKNVHSNNFKTPETVGRDHSGDSLTIRKNINAYRFSFIEKNRIDNFSRISTGSKSDQKDRISSLFGIDDFSNFVDGFTDDFDGRYIKIINKDKEKFTVKNSEYIRNKEQLLRSPGKISSIESRISTELEKINLKINTTDPISHLQDIIKSKQSSLLQSIPKKEDDSLIEKLTTKIKTYKESLNNINTLTHSINTEGEDSIYEELYNAINQIQPKNECPACKTALTKTTNNPYEVAKHELTRLEIISKNKILLNKNKEIASKLTFEINSIIDKINTIDIHVKSHLTKIPKLTNDLKTSHGSSLHKLDLRSISFIIQEKRITEYNNKIDSIQEIQDSTLIEINTFQNISSKISEISGEIKSEVNTKIKLEKAIALFEDNNKVEIERLSEIDKKITSNIVYKDKFISLVKKLKSYRDKLPLSLSRGLSEVTAEFYNIINHHDADFEQLQMLSLPTRTDDKIQIKFKNSSKFNNALMILSEGHLKSLGLCILLAKAYKEELGFIIYDDIVNAIDDDHRDGIAELILKSPKLMSKQHIITCHGDTFIRKLEQKMGHKLSSKNVDQFAFKPADMNISRGVQILGGSPQHYISKAEEEINKDSRKFAASACRQAVEALTDNLWKKLKDQISVGMRSPSGRPDLHSVTAGLNKKIKTIPDIDPTLKDGMITLVENYNWQQLNKGAHEQSDLPEFERADILKMIALLKQLDNCIQEFKLTKVSVPS